MNLYTTFKYCDIKYIELLDKINIVKSNRLTTTEKI